MNEAVYGYCPICSAPGVSRERRFYGDDQCSSGHKYRSRESLSKKEENNPTPPWVVRSREEMKAKQKEMDKLPDTEFYSWDISELQGGILTLEELLKAEGYGVNND